MLTPATILMPLRHGERQEMPLLGNFGCLKQCLYMLDVARWRRRRLYSIRAPYNRFFPCMEAIESQGKARSAHRIV